MNQSPETVAGTNYSAAQTGSFESLNNFAYPHPVLQKDIEGKLFLKEALGLTGMEVSLNKLPPRAFVPFLHRHKENEELYVFVKGEGEMVVDGDVVPVREGTCVRVGQAGARAWRNTSETEPLYYLVIQAKAGTMPGGTIHDGERVEGRPRFKKRAG